MSNNSLSESAAWVRKLLARNSRVEKRKSAVVERFRRKMTQCPWCGSRLFQEVDHRIPIAEGGKDSPENLQCPCSDCHKVKTMMDNSGITTEEALRATKYMHLKGWFPE